MGEALYPHPQWARLAAVWEEYYPPAGLESDSHALLRRLEDATRVPAVVMESPRGIADAHAHMGANSNTGKILIDIAPEA